jgi:endonuclease/exonuclease/phosphatase family metal-dependent hydrolase
VITPALRPRASTFAALVLVALLGSGCGDAPSRREKSWRPSNGEFSVMTYNLRRYCLDDRDRDGQAAEPKPDHEIQALIRVIARVRPDVLAVQEIGPRPMFDDFQNRLHEAGVPYNYAEFVQSPITSISVAVLSRLPIIESAPITNETYTIGHEVLPVQRGFANVVIEVSPSYRFRLLVAHLKSKLFHPLGQTEMRRNEARLLNKWVRRFLRDDPEANLLVVGDMNDTMGSDALRELVGAELVDLRPHDYLGDVWSHFWAEQDEYARIDYMLVSESMRPEAVRRKTHAVRDPLTAIASDHRPLVSVFKARDL